MKEEIEAACHKRKKMSAGIGVEVGGKAAPEGQRQRATNSDTGKWEFVYDDVFARSRSYPAITCTDVYVL